MFALLTIQAWGGARLYTGNREEIYEALHGFIGNNYKDPKAAVIFTGMILHLTPIEFKSLTFSVPTQSAHFLQDFHRSHPDLEALCSVRSVACLVRLGRECSQVSLDYWVAELNQLLHEAQLVPPF